MAEINDKTTPEEISAHIDSFKPDLTSSDFIPQNNAISNLEGVLSHPSFTQEHHDSIYNHLMDSESDYEDGIEKLLDSPHLSPAQANGMFSKLSSNRSSIIDKFLDRPDIDHTPLENSILADIDNDDIAPADLDIVKNLKPDFYFNLLANRPKYEKDSENEDQQKLENKARKIDRKALSGLVYTNKHTPESLARFTDILTGDDIVGRHFSRRLSSDGDDHLDTISSFIDKQSDISHKDIDRLYSKYAESRISDEILAHPNTDPGLLAKVIKNKDGGYERGLALKHKNAPIESLNSVINDDEDLENNFYYIKANPSLTSEQVQVIYDKGHSKILEHPNSTPELHAKAWESSAKDLDSAKAHVNYDNTPESVLLDLVNHKNQDIAVKALKHKNATQAVVEAGLARKAEKVNTAAAKHPLVKDTELKKGILSGKFNLNDLDNKDIGEVFSKLNPEEKNQFYENQNNLYSGTDWDKLESKLKVPAQKIKEHKVFLATDPSVPEHIRESNTKDIVNNFKDNVSDNQGELGWGANRKLSAFNKLMETGSKQAQEAALSKPAYLVDIDEDTLKAQGPDFITKAVRSLEGMIGKTFYNDRGMPIELRTENILPVIKKYASAKNASLAETERYLKSLSPGIYDEGISLTGRYFNKGTILDKKFEGLDDQEKYDQFKSILDSGHTKAVVASHSAPLSLKEEAFLKLSPDDLKDLAEGKMDFGKLPEDIYKSLIDGTTTHPDDVDLLQTRSLFNLDHTNDSHKDVFNHFLESNKNQPEFDQLTENDIRYNTPKEFLEKNLDILSNHSNSYPNLWEESLIKNISGELDQDKFNDLISAIDNHSAKFDYNNTVNSNIWSLALNNTNSKKALSEFVSNHPGSLDFLVDKNNESLIGKLLSNNLLSPELDKKLRDEIKNKDYFAYINSLSPDKKREETSERIDDLINNRDLSFSQLQYLTDSIHLNEISHDKDSALDAYSKLFDRLSSLPDDRATDKVLSRIANLEINSGKDNEKFHKAFVDHIKASGLPEERKSLEIDQFYSELVRRNKLKGSLQKDYLSKAILDKNVDRLSFALTSDNKNSIKGLTKQVESLITSGELSASKLKSLSWVVKHPTFTGASIKKLDAAFEASLNAGLTDGTISPEEASDLRVSYVSNLSSVNVDSPKTKISTTLAILKKNANSDAAEVRDTANRGLINYLQSSSLELSERRDLFVSMSDNISDVNASLPVDMMNDPEVIEAASPGWKLNSMVMNLSDLSEENASQIISRAMTEEGLHHLKDYSVPISQTAKSYLMTKTADSLASKEDVIKVARSLSIEDMTSLFRGDFTHSNGVYHAVGPLWDKTKDYLNDPQVLPTDIRSIMTGFANSIDDFTIQEGDTDPKGKQEVFNKLAADIAKTYSSMLTSGNKGKALASEDLANSFLIYISKNNSLKVNADTLTHGFKLAQDLQANISTDRFSSDDEIKAYRGLVSKSENISPEVWEDLAKNPNYPYTLSESKEINDHMLKHIDLDSMYGKHGALFASEASEWVKSMDRPTMEKYGPKLLKQTLAIPYTETNSDSLGSILAFSERFIDYDSAVDIYKTVPEDYKTQVIESFADKGVGGEKFAETLMDLNTFSGKVAYNTTTLALSKSPSITKKIADSITKSFPIEGHDSKQYYENLSKNPNTPNDTVDQISDQLLANHKNGYKNISKDFSSNLALKLIKNRNISYDKLKEIHNVTNEEMNLGTVFKASANFHPALLNPRWGSKLLREQPLDVPESISKQGLNHDAVVRDITASTKVSSKIKEVMAVIPPEGIDWVSFKKTYPKFENIKEVKELFTKKNGKVIPEDLIPVIKQAEKDDSFNSYHITFGTWGAKDIGSGLQRHNMKSPDNMVMQINTSQKADDELSKDPILYGLYQMVQKETNGISSEGRIGMHPTSPHAVGWSRIDMSNKGVWIIEEFQSDVAQKFRRNLASMVKNSPSGIKVEGKDVTPAQLKEYATKLSKVFEGWETAMMEAIQENAKAQGVHTLYLHGTGIRHQMSGGSAVDGRVMEYNKNHMNKTMTEIYDGTAQKYNFEKCEYQDYPNWSSKTLSDTTKRELPTYCWKLKLA